MTEWPHAPSHCLKDTGAYIVTSGTYEKQHFFSSPERLNILQDSLFNLASHYGWELQAWAVFCNHYHFVAMSPPDVSSLKTFISHLHTTTARAINQLDGVNKRCIWYQYWENHLTYEKSYLSRLKYVHFNAVHHNIVPIPTQYPWCSATWFEQASTRSFINTVYSFKIDQLNIFDGFLI
jgi:putative transposase